MDSVTKTILATVPSPTRNLIQNPRAFSGLQCNYLGSKCVLLACSLKSAMAEYYRSSMIVALAIRIVLLVYSEFHDHFMDVKYTDIDYLVFTDAAAYVARGQSPYLRSTYRYTPILAWLLTPNIFIHPLCGKLLFILADLLTGYLMSRILKQMKVSEKLKDQCLLIWLCNPVTLTISTRGSAESIMSCLVLGVLHLLQTRRVVLGGIVYGVAIHFKIYPIIYCLPLYFSLTPLVVQNNFRSFRAKFFALVYPSILKVKFTTATLSVLFALSFLGYALYGFPFLEEAYLYHIQRNDTRHNFSLYFYMLYLTSQSPRPLLGLVMFLPQIALFLLLSWKFYQPRNLPFCLFATTFVFVTLNKVCTSQYFVWYISILPLILPQLKMSVSRAVTLASLWFLCQGLWLLPAYLLEFQGLNTFVLIWIASIVFFVTNVMILVDIVRHCTLM